MPGKDGFTFLQEIPKDHKMPGIVFVTAYEQFAVQAIKNKAFDYLLKPVNRKELKQCILRFMESKDEVQAPDNHIKTADNNDRINRIKINTRTGTVFVNPDTILFLKAEGNYTTICTGEKQYLCSMNLGRLEGELPKKGFIRVGRSYIINYEYITLLDRKDSTVTLVRENESTKVKLPRQHLKDLDMI